MVRVLDNWTSLPDLAAAVVDHLSRKRPSGIIQGMVGVEGMHPSYPIGVMTSGDLVVVRAYGGNAYRISTICGYATPAGVDRLRAVVSGDLKLRLYRPGLNRPPADVVIARGRDYKPSERYSFASVARLRSRLNQLPTPVSRALMRATQFSLYDPRWGRSEQLLKAVTRLAR